MGLNIHSLSLLLQTGEGDRRASAEARADNIIKKPYDCTPDLSVNLASPLI